MGILWDVKNIWNKVGAVKDIVTSPAFINKAKQTLNQQIDGWFSDNQNIVEDQPVIAPGADDNRPLNERVTDWVGKTALKAYSDWQDVWEDAMARLFSAPSRYRNYVWESKQETDASREYESGKKHVALGYNPDYDSIYTLESNNVPLLNQIVSDTFAKLSDNPTYEEYETLRDEARKNAKDLFELKSQPATTNYREKFSQEELDKLQANNAHLWSYEPSIEEFYDYLGTLDENSEIYDNIQKKYNLEDGRVTLDASNDEIAQTISQFYEIADGWIQDRINSVIWSVDGREAAEATLYYRDAVSDQINRIMPFVQSIFKYEKEALAKAPSERNDWDWYIIETANIARKALDKYASNLNNWMNYIISEGVNDKWQIADALDRFSNDQSLNDILRDWLQNIMWLETLWSWKHISPIDMFQALANDWIYKYQQANTSNLYRRAWNWLEKRWQYAWDWEAEVGQYFGTRPIHIVDVFVKWRPQSVSYLDMDFSIGKLIETDDSRFKRTVKKYALKFQEYAPEWIATVLPDIALIMYNAPGWASKALTTIGDLWRFRKKSLLNRMFKATERINELRKTSTWLDKTLKWLEKVRELWLKWSNINSRRARFWNIVDRTLTQYALWQAMDAKLSVFDTEPYSDTSFWISTIWSALWDILPEVKDLWWITRTWIKWWKWLRTAWVWDLVDFIEQSDENASLIAQALWKKYKYFTEQELKDYVATFAEVSDAAKIVYNQLSAEWKEAANSWTKQLLYNYVKQAYWGESHLWKAVRQILINKNTSPADIIKYVWRIPWDVQFGPYTSVIRLKNWTLAWVAAKDWWRYDIALDALDWWFARRVSNGFSENDIREISWLNWYNDVYKDKDRLFRKSWDKYYLSNEWLDYFNLSKNSATLEALWIDIADAENVREIFKEKMKDLPNKKISERWINMLADTWGYDEIVNKVKEILC